MLFSGGTSGFSNAPVTKAWIITTGVCSLVTSLMDLGPFLHLQVYPHLIRHGQYWRLLTCSFGYSTSAELFFGSLLVYHLRIIERQFGSAKYFALLLWCTITAVTLQVLFSWAWWWWWLQRLGELPKLPLGPYAALFASLWQFYQLIPKGYQFKVLGITFSDKIFVNLLCAQLLYLQFPGSLLVGASGITAGILYRCNFLNAKKLKLPRWVRWIGGTLLAPLFFLGSSEDGRRGRFGGSGSRATRIEELNAFRDLSRGFPSTAAAATTATATATATATTNTTANTTANVATTATVNRGESARGESPDGLGYLDQMLAAQTSDMERPREEDVTMLMTLFPHLNRAQAVRNLMENGNQLERAATAVLDTMQFNDESLAWPTQRGESSR